MIIRYADAIYSVTYSRCRHAHIEFTRLRAQRSAALRAAILRVRLCDAQYVSMQRDTLFAVRRVRATTSAMPRCAAVITRCRARDSRYAMSMSLSIVFHYDKMMRGLSLPSIYMPTRR